MSDKRLVRAALALVVAGCGFASAAGSHISFPLPQRTYTLDTADSSLFSLPPGGVPMLTCGDGGMVEDCCMPLGVPFNCAAYPLTCDGGACTLTLRLDVAQGLNLAMEVPQLNGFAGKHISDMTLTTLTYDITSTLNVDVPPVDLYVAAASAKTAADPTAQKIGTIPATPAGMKNTGTIELDDAARAAFRMYALDFQTTFNVIASTRVALKPGVTPMGRMDIGVGGTGEAQFSVVSQ